MVRYKLREAWGSTQDALALSHSLSLRLSLSLRPSLRLILSLFTVSHKAVSLAQ